MPMQTTNIVEKPQFIRKVNFFDLKHWDYYSYSGLNSVNANYNIVQLKDVLKLRKKFIAINDDVIYKRCRVQLYSKGVVTRDEIAGKEIKTKRQQVCKTNDFLVAEIDAKFGGYGVVPSNLDSAIVSSHYFLFEIDKQKLLPEFLELVVKLEQFSKQVRATGSTNYAAIRPYHVLEYSIPLPDLLTQARLIKDYKKELTKLENVKMELEDTNTAYNEIFNRGLALDFIVPNRVQTGLYFKNYQKLQRWDIWNGGYEVFSKKFEFVPIKSFVIEKPQYGANVKAVEKKTDIRYIRITDINEDGTLNEDIVSAEKVEKRYLLDDFDFLIARSGNTVGKTFLYREYMGKAIYAGYLIRFKLNKQKIDPYYLLYYTKSKAFKLWIANSQRVSGQPNINGQEFLSALIVLPDLNKQKQIVKQVDEIRKKTQDLNKKMEDLQKNILLGFQKKLFN